MLALLAVASLLVPAPVAGLAADGRRVAVASGCADVRIWTPPARRATRLLGRACGPATSTGRGIAAVSLARNRALWVTYTGGNVREWTLWTATTTRPRARRLAFAARDVDAPPPLVLGEGDADLLPYAKDRRVVVLRANGSLAFVWDAPERVVSLAAHGGELAVATASSVTVLDGGGSVLDVVGSDAPIDVVRLTGNGIAIQSGRSLEVTGPQPAQLMLAAGVRLADAGGGRLLLVGGGRVRVVATDGTLVRGVRGTFGQLEGSRLYRASGRRVTAG